MSTTTRAAADAAQPTDARWPDYARYAEQAAAHCRRLAILLEHLDGMGCPRVTDADTLLREFRDDLVHFEKTLIFEHGFAMGRSEDAESVGV